MLRHIPAANVFATFPVNNATYPDSGLYDVFSRLRHFPATVRHFPRLWRFPAMRHFPALQCKRHVSLLTLKQLIRASLNDFKFFKMKGIFMKSLCFISLKCHWLIYKKQNGFKSSFLWKWKWGWFFHIFKTVHFRCGYVCACLEGYNLTQKWTILNEVKFFI